MYQIEILKWECGCRPSRCFDLAHFVAFESTPIYEPLSFECAEGW